MNTHQERIAVVTGGARGIGRAICHGLAAAGAQVAVVDLQQPIDTVAEIAARGQNAVGFAVDVADPDHVDGLASEVLERFGRCDILVNNAGIYPFIDFADVDFDTWRNVISINLDSQFLMARAFVPSMRAQSWGRIVNIVSDSIGHTATGLVHYMASKMGSIGFTRGLANDLGDFGITVNAVAPSLTRTPGVVDALPPERLQAVAQNQAIKRVAEPEDIVGSVLFLTSESCSFVTGQTIMADGGSVKL